MSHHVKLGFNTFIPSNTAQIFVTFFGMVNWPFQGAQGNKTKKNSKPWLLLDHQTHIKELTGLKERAHILRHTQRWFFKHSTQLWQSHLWSIGCEVQMPQEGPLFSGSAFLSWGKARHISHWWSWFMGGDRHNLKNLLEGLAVHQPVCKWHLTPTVSSKIPST